MDKNGSNRPHKVLVILSSVREGRQGAKVAQAVIKHLGSYANLNAEILGKENISNLWPSLCLTHKSIDKLWLNLRKFGANLKKKSAKSRPWKNYAPKEKMLRVAIWQIFWRFEPKWTTFWD